MSPEAEAVLHWEIERVLKRFQIVDFGRLEKRHFGVSQIRNGRPFLIRSSLDREQAAALVRRLQTEAILQLIKELAPDVRAAD